jgi:hypothetical protein
MFLLKKVLFPFCFSLIAFAREKSSAFGALLKSVKVSESEILLLVEIFLTISLIEMSTWDMSMLRSNIIY